MSAPEKSFLVFLLLGGTEVDIDDGKDWDIFDINEGKNKRLRQYAGVC